jgi:hypothetical protein
MNRFDFKAVGDPSVAASKFGSTSGSSVDIIRPVSQQVDKAFQPGRQQQFEWRSDPNRYFLPRATRLALDLEFKFGEVDTTKADVTAAPTNAFAPPSRDVSLCALPGAQLFDSQVRFTANNTVIEQTNYYSDMAHAQLLTTTTNDAASNFAGVLLDSKNGTYTIGEATRPADSFKLGSFHKVEVTLTAHSVSAMLDGKSLGKSSGKGISDGFYIMMSLDRYVFADVDNFQLTV